MTWRWLRGAKWMYPEVRRRAAGVPGVGTVESDPERVALVLRGTCWVGRGVCRSSRYLLAKTPCIVGEGSNHDQQGRLFGWRGMYVSAVMYMICGVCVSFCLYARHVMLPVRLISVRSCTK